MDPFLVGIFSCVSYCPDHIELLSDWNLKVCVVGGFKMPCEYTCNMRGIYKSLLSYNILVGVGNWQTVYFREHIFHYYLFIQIFYPNDINVYHWIAKADPTPELGLTGKLKLYLIRTDQIISHGYVCGYRLICFFRVKSMKR